jgi:hypothetical protein
VCDLLRATALALLVLICGCEQAGSSADDDDTTAGDDDDTSSADDDTSGDDDTPEDCTHPDEATLAELYAEVHDYLTADDPGDDPALLTRLDEEYADVCFEHFADAIRARPGATAFEPGVSIQGYFVEHWETIQEVAVYVPDGLTDDARPPLVVWLHGAGSDTGPTWASNPTFQALADAQGAILACPTSDEICDWSATESCGAQVLSVVRHLKRRFPIDDDRVYLTGHSMGGRGSFTMGLTYPSTYAGLLPSAATIGATAGTLDVGYHETYCLPHAENALHQRVELHTGLLDNEYLVAQNEGATAAFDTLGYDFDWLAMPDAGHAMDTVVWSEGMARVMGHTRAPYPDHVIWNQAEHGSSYYDYLYLHEGMDPPEFWLRLDDRADSQALGRVEGTVDGATVSVVTDNVTELTVMLADELLDLDLEITVEVDGEVWFEGRVERSAYLALTSARERSERSMVFSVRLRGDVPGSGAID